MWTRQDDPTISPICHCPNTEVVIKGHIFYGIAQTIIPGFFVKALDIVLKGFVHSHFAGQEFAKPTYTSGNRNSRLVAT